MKHTKNSRRKPEVYISRNKKHFCELINKIPYIVRYGKTSLGNDGGGRRSKNPRLTPKYFKYIFFIIWEKLKKQE